MELNDVMRTTFAARDYTGEDLPDSVLHEILENARFAPSGGNRQGNRVIVVRDQATKDALARLAEPGARLYTAQRLAGENPWNTIVPSAFTSDTVSHVEVPAQMTGPARKCAVLLVFLVDLKVVASLDKDLDRVGVISGASIYPFVWNVLLGARQAGFGGTITTVAVAQEPKVRELLNIPGDHAVAAVVPLGKPVKQLTRLRRKSVAEIATRDRFDGPSFTTD